MIIEWICIILSSLSLLLLCFAGVMLWGIGEGLADLIRKIEKKDK